MNEDTFPKLLLRNAARWPDRHALREKEYGIWRPLTWRQYLERARHFSLGLISLGLQPGDKVAIIGDNRPEWVIAELAAQAAGAVSVGLFQDAVSAEVQYIIDHCDATFVVVEDQEQVDKLLEIFPQLPKVQRVIYYDPRGLRSYAEPYLLDFSAVERLGREYERDHPDLFERNVAASSAEDVALICYTSGTTGMPKGAMLSYRNLLAMARNLLSVDPMEPGDEFVSYLPLAWIGEQMMSLSCGLLVGFTVNFPEEPETVQANIREIAPQTMFAPPRIWENMVATVQVKMGDASWLKRTLYRWAMRWGERRAEARFTRRRLLLGERSAIRLADLLVFHMLRDQLGLLRIRRAYTGGAALGPDVFRFFHAIGVNLKQIYGQTEISGISVVHRDDDIRLDTMGVPIPATEVTISARGEILSRSPSVFLGYYKDPAATATTLVDGWLHSGDAGLIDENGHLVVIDRMQDVMTLTEGSKFSPQYIENKLKFSPYVREAVAFGGGRDFVAALINIDFPNVGKWAEDHQIPYTTYTDLASKPEIYRLIARDVERVNRDLPAVARIRRFVLLHKELDADDAELTRTRKVRRAFVEDRYRTIVEALYSATQSVPVTTEIVYQDGRRVTIATTLPIWSVQTEQATSSTVTA